MHGKTVQEVGRTIAAPTALADGQAKLRVRLIAGEVQGSSGFYPRSVIERDGAKVFAEGTHMHLDHQSFFEFYEKPEGSLKDLVAVIDSTPVYESDNPMGEGLYSDVRVFSNWAPVIKEMAPYIGVSIRAAVTKEEGVSPETGEVTDIITELIAALSVDFVTHPGADGRIVEVLENAGPAILPPGAKIVHIDPARESGTTKREKKPMADITEETAKALGTSIDALTAILTAEAADRAAAATAAKKAEEDAGKLDVEEIIAEATTKLVAAGFTSKVTAKVLESVKAGKNIDVAITEMKELLTEANAAPAARPGGVHVADSSAGGASGAATESYAWESRKSPDVAAVSTLASRYTGKVAK